jgi:hypothetical protein
MVCFSIAVNYTHLISFKRAITQVRLQIYPLFITLYSLSEYKEAFALFDKRGNGAVPRETLGDLLRALGQNPTQSEVAEIVASAPRDGASIRTFYSPVDHQPPTYSGLQDLPINSKPSGWVQTRRNTRYVFPSCFAA